MLLKVEVINKTIPHKNSKFLAVRLDKIALPISL